MQTRERGNKRARARPTPCHHSGGPPRQPPPPPASAAPQGPPPPPVAAPPPPRRPRLRARGAPEPGGARVGACARGRSAGRPTTPAASHSAPVAGPRAAADTRLNGQLMPCAAASARPERLPSDNALHRAACGLVPPPSTTASSPRCAARLTFPVLALAVRWGGLERVQVIPAAGRGEGALGLLCIPLCVAPASATMTVVGGRPSPARLKRRPGGARAAAARSAPLAGSRGGPPPRAGGQSAVYPCCCAVVFCLFNPLWVGVV